MADGSGVFADASHAAILEAALPQLCRLTRLALPSGARLQQLPPGEWLASLRSLEAPAVLVAASLPVLSAAQQLQHLALRPPPSRPYAPEAVAAAAVARWADGAAAAVRWAAGQPALLRLELLQMGRNATAGPELLMAVAHLVRSRPDVAFEAEAW